MLEKAYTLTHHFFDSIYNFLSNIIIPGTTLSAMSFFVGVLSIGFVIMVIKIFFRSR